MLFTTERLVVEEFKTSDAHFIRELVNEPAWKRYIGERNINSEEDAIAYINHRIREAYKQFGYGFYKVSLKEDNTPIGLCGLIDREGLEDTDLGFAFLHRHRRKGYGFESARGMMKHAVKKWNKKRLLAITNKDNFASGSLLEKLGFKNMGVIRLESDDMDECRLFEWYDHQT